MKADVQSIPKIWYFLSFRVHCFKPELDIGCQSRLKNEEQNLRRGGVKKRHGHNIEFWALSLLEIGENIVGSNLTYYIKGKSPKLNIVAVSFFTPRIFDDGPVFSDSSIYDGL